MTRSNRPTDRKVLARKVAEERTVAAEKRAACATRKALQAETRALAVEQQLWGVKQQLWGVKQQLAEMQGSRAWRLARFLSRPYRFWQRHRPGQEEIAQQAATDSAAHELVPTPGPAFTSVDREAEAARPVLLIVGTGRDEATDMTTAMLCRLLFPRHTVVAWLTATDTAPPGLEQVADTIELLPASYEQAPEIVADLQARHAPTSAIVNGSQARAVLGALSLAGLPVTTLVHETADHTLSPYTLQEIAYWSERTVFAHHATLARTRATWPNLLGQVCHYLPTPIMTVPPETTDTAAARPEAYGAAWQQLTRQAADDARQMQADIETIRASGRFLADYFDTDAAPGDPLKRYLNGWRSGLTRRRPCPGFHPGVYRQNRLPAGSRVDPFADYLRQGTPDGPWCTPVIEPGDANGMEAVATPPVALHIHAYYPELMAEVVQRIVVNRCRPDLFVSVRDEDCRRQALAQLTDYPGQVIDVRVVPNIGRDIGPMLTAFGPRLCADYAIIGHLHTKRSAHVPDPEAVERWRHLLLENLLGGEQGRDMADTILATMSAHSDLGLVCPADPVIAGWGANEAIARLVATCMGIHELPEHFNFPVGTMFWARAELLQPFVDLGFEWDDYPAEPLGVDGSLLHALERLLGVVPAHLGLYSSVTRVPGVTR